MVRASASGSGEKSLIRANRRSYVLAVIVLVLVLEWLIPDLDFIHAIWEALKPLFD